MQVIDKQTVHDLVDRLTPDQIPVAANLIRSMVKFPIEDEPISEEEERAVAEADAWLAQNGGRGIPMEEVLAEYGLTMDHFPLKDQGSGSHD